MFTFASGNEKSYLKLVKARIRAFVEEDVFSSIVVKSSFENKNDDRVEVNVFTIVYLSYYEFHMNSLSNVLLMFICDGKELRDFRIRGRNNVDILNSTSNY